MHLFGCITFGRDLLVVLWTIGGALNLTVGGATVTIPGFLVVTSIVYAAITSMSMFVIGRYFVRLCKMVGSRA